ncbi:MAG TPA: multicopper oxidase domain-containing protein, partial [Longimicrobiales bacterium]|nr:multicopper oxidase domain-containing protein [Longimicrobiales bacterium]
VASRRSFLRTAAIGIAVPAALASCKNDDAPNRPANTPPDTTKAGNAAPDSDHSGGTNAAHPVTAGSNAAADEMDRMHEAGVKAFPARTEGKGNQILQPRLENGVKVYELTCKKVQWEVEVGKRVEAWTYNGVVPGPQIRVKEGDRVRIIVKNELAESTAVHFHGLEIPNDQDGVPFITQPPIKPGQSYTYEFVAPNPGSHMYHSHHNAAKQVGMGLLGAFIIEPRQKRAIENVDVDYVMILNDGYHGYTLNGKGFPATEPVVAKLGQKVRIRFMNEGMMIHPMHLHGMHMTVIDKDGWPQPAPWKCDTLNIAPGERWDVIVNCNNPGVWAFHCHILPHAESQHGMFGMVTALIVQK